MEKKISELEQNDVSDKVSIVHKNKRGEIISKITNIVNLTCVDISGIIYEDMDFIIRISLSSCVKSGPVFNAP